MRMPQKSWRSYIFEIVSVFELHLDCSSPEADHNRDDNIGPDIGRNSGLEPWLRPLVLNRF